MAVCDVCLQEGFAIEDDFGATDDFTREDDDEEEFQRARRQAEEENERRRAAEGPPAQTGTEETKVQNGGGNSLLSLPELILVCESLESQRSGGCSLVGKTTKYIVQCSAS